MPQQNVELRPAGGTPLVLTTAPLDLGLDTHWGDVASDASLTEGPEIVGAVAGIRTRPSAERSLVVQIKASTSIDYLSAAVGLVSVVTALQEGGGTVSRQLDFGGNRSAELECEVLSAHISEADDGWLEVHRTFAEVTLTLTTQPQWLDAWEIVGETLDSTASLIEVPIAELRGNLPGPGRVTLSDDAATARHFLELGGAFRDYDQLAEIEFRAATFSLAETDGTLVADGSVIGPDVVEVSPVLPVWRTAAYLPGLSHRGSFRVRGRAEFDTDEAACFMRVSWRSGQGAWKELGVVEVPSGGFYDLDIGPLHHYDSAETVEFRFDVRASAVESTTPFRLNLITITPSEVYAVVRGLSVPVPSTGAAAFDSLGEATALDTRVSELGDVWDVVSGTPDFEAGGWGVIRAGTEDADLESGLSALLGTATTHNSVVFSGEVSHKGDPLSDVWLLAYIRYVDADNWGAVGWRIRRRNDGDYEPYAALYMRHGGGDPVLLKQRSASTGRGMRSLITGPVGITISDDGDYEVLIGRTGYGATAPEVNEVLFSGNEPEFAVGGDLAAGKIGVLSSIQSDRQSAYTALFDIAAYSEISASTQVDVIRANGIGQLDHTQAVSAADGVVSPQPVSRYDGRRIWLPPGEGLITAKVRSGDSEVEVDAGAGLQTDVLIEHRPAFATLSDLLQGQTFPGASVNPSDTSYPA